MKILHVCYKRECIKWRMALRINWHMMKTFRKVDVKIKRFYLYFKKALINMAI